MPNFLVRALNGGIGWVNERAPNRLMITCAPQYDIWPHGST